MRLRIVYNFFTGGKPNSKFVPKLGFINSKTRTNVRQAVDDIRLRDAIPKNPAPPQFVDKNKTWQNK